ncbi:MAG TPA: hypothetical protein VMY42_06830 [Thermoguttaceae bacterium]|nr:hypothetical protein [Thermoguttaceae bacterium]
MGDQTVASLFTQSIPPEQIFVGDKDRGVLRRLAGKTAELAARPVEEEKRDLWYRHNALEATRPVVFCDPENGWNEIITEDQIECEGELARGWEMTLRKEIFWAESMGDDKVVDAVFHVRHVYQESDWGMHETITKVVSHGSYRWDAPLKDYDQFDQLRFPEITVDYDSTDKLLALAGETFGDLLDVRLKTMWWWTLGMTWTLINLRGLQQVMMDMYDHPDGLHRVMGILRDGHLAKLDFLQENNLLSLNTENTYVGSGGFGFTRELPQPDFDGTHVRTMDMWGFCESQETVQVSPAMFEEFIFPYQLPILERFGLNCYGCCEPLDKRWHVVRRFPRLRRISVSAWADFGKMAEYLGADYIYSLKPSPADLALPQINEDRIRRELRKVLGVTKGCRMELMMKDNHTIGNNPQNVIRWCRIAQEEAAACGCS